MKKFYIFIIATLLVGIVNAQNSKPSLGIIEFKSVGIEQSNQDITDIFRFEIEKSKKYLLLDKDEMQVRFSKEKVNPENCYNQLCLVFAGKTLLVDKMLSGSVSKLGENRLVTFKLYDVTTNKLETSKKIEIIADSDESINTIISKAMHEFFNAKDDLVSINISEKQKLIEKEKEEEKEIAKKEEEKKLNTSPDGVIRYYNGVPISSGPVKSREKESRFPKFAIYMKPFALMESTFTNYTKANIGVQYSIDDLTAIKLSYGYMFESQADNIWTIYGNEPGIYSGYELKGEFVFRLPKDYFGDDNLYSRFYIGAEAGLQKKFHKEIVNTQYVQNVGTISYLQDGIQSRVILGSIKIGFQNLISNKIYIDPFMGLGIKSINYSETIQYNYNDPYGYGNYYYLRNRAIPNFTAGVDFGILIK